MNAKHLNDIASLREDEDVVRIVRRYPLTLFWKIFFAVVLILAPFFFLFPLFSLGIWGVGIFLSVFFFGIVYALRLFVLWYYATTIITRERVIDVHQKGFFDRVVSAISYDKVQDISYHQSGIAELLFHYGNVQIQLANTNTKIQLKHIVRPQEIQELLMELEHAYIPRRESTSDLRQNERVETHWKHLKKMSQGELRTIQKKIGEKLEDRDRAMKDFLDPEKDET